MSEFIKLPQFGFRPLMGIIKFNPDDYIEDDDEIITLSVP